MKFRYFRSAVAENRFEIVYLVALGLLGVGLGAYDWRLGCIAVGAVGIVTVAAVAGIWPSKNGGG